MCLMPVVIHRILQLMVPDINVLIIQALPVIIWDGTTLLGCSGRVTPATRAVISGKSDKTR